MMIRAQMRGVAEVDRGLLPLRKRSDPRIVPLEPLLHQRLVAFQRAMQRPLASDAELRQKPSDRDQAQRDVEFVLDQRGHHLARPQGKSELELQRALLRHRVINPPELSAIEFRRTSEQRLGFQRPPSTTSILCQPAIHRGTVDSQNTRNNLRALTVLNAARCVIQLSRIVLSHAHRESYSLHPVKNYLVTYVLINNYDAMPAA